MAGAGGRAAGSESTLEVQLSAVLPAAQDERDQCVQRLRERLSGTRGLRDAHVHDRDGQAVVCVHYDPVVLPLDRLRRVVSQTGAQVSDRYRHAWLRVTGMDCGDCSASIEHVLTRQNGVLAASVSYAAERLRVEFDSDVVSLDDLVRLVRAMGYGVEVPRRRGWVRTRAELLLALAAGVLLAMGFAGETFLDWPATVVVVAYGLAYLTGGFTAARHAAAAAVRLRLQIDALMVVAAVGAAVVGAWAEGALLLFLFSLGHALEHRAMGRARHAIEALGTITPHTARVRREGTETELDVREVLRGDVVIVRPGERVPVDGSVRGGRSTVDQSPITGESTPVDKAPGAAVFAGTVNHDGVLEVEVTRLAGESTLARVVTMVQEAQTQKSPTQRLTERFTAVFVPAVLLLAAAVIAVPPLLGWLTWQVAFLRGMAVLVAASPCALAIGTPAAVLSGIARAARTGVLVKGGVHLENLGRVDAMAFDKTGTLTSGHPVVTDVRPAAGVDPAALLSTAATVESRSTHPLARAVVAAAQGLPLGRAGEVTIAAGKGITAAVDGRQVRVGRPGYVLPSDPPDEIRGAVAELEAAGRTVIAVDADGHLLGVLGLADQPRDGAKPMLQQLRRLGVTSLVLLTGDNPHVAADVARSLSLTDYRAGLLPEDKVDAIAGLTRQHRVVAMVGDGVNDAPALARSTIGIAMGTAGTDIALETADVALMADDLSKLPAAVGLGRRSRRVIRQNLAVALCVIAVLLPAAVLGIAGIGAAIVVHEGSTLAVVANALRLLR
ncbi:cation-translocating P-type ATPase [Micromonospora aurantiaca]|uniref:heavy metal translocating P-type ATPase n=1 Tax=Micromonospora TaxID=1873 RepID=UPI00068AF72A|nr:MULTISPECIES: cation-translocating P-type ATPase [Micromonospora]MCT2279907.1 cadmium-translocating P-type ATPase [Micromonospora chalcea]MDG4752735.1 cation-translocating P-type ATPase [Micromonospora sp. WMMD718]UFN92539.1 cadmium-translocating P-type ATPase [Micromonospora aurantiaca]SCL43194.1 Cd2+/Zn2+-exporting ATPase [Micromonospora aurantiaca]